MANKGRLYKIGGAGGNKGRLYKVSTSVSGASNKGRLYKVVGAVLGGTNTGRLFKAQGLVTRAPVIVPGSNLQVDSYIRITLDASGNVGAATASWEQQSGPTVALSLSGLTCALIPPASVNGTTITLNVTTTTAGGLVSDPTTVSIYVYPHQEYVIRSGVATPVILT